MKRASAERAAMRARVVGLLTAMGVALQRRGDLHRARAYMRAAREVARREDFDALLAADRLREIPGVGASIAATIRRFAQTGETPAWVEETPVLDAAAWPEVPGSYHGAPFPEAPDLHCHTTWSDGTLTVDEVVAFARLLGARAVGISDHSGSLHVAHGLLPGRVRAQWAEIDRVQAETPDLRLLKGTECDILRDGTLDHPREILAGFDYVIGSLHSGLRLPREEQTARVLRALEDPHLTILGHPTTRVPGARPPADLDLEAVFGAAARRGVALEVNGNPGRLDLDVDLARRALAHGCALALGSDGHSAHEMLALETARRVAAEAGATRERIVNHALLEKSR